MSRSPNIPKDLKEEAICRMLPPNNESPKSVAESLGMNYDTIRHLKSDALKDNAEMNASGNRPATLPSQVHRISLSSADKFQIVVETFSMTETELGEYARQRGLYVEEIKLWRDSCINANGGTSANELHLAQQLKAQQQENKELRKEVVRKDKTIAEVTALLVLSKKAQAIWGKPWTNDQRLRPRGCYSADQ